MQCSPSFIGICGEETTFMKKAFAVEDLRAVNTIENSKAEPIFPEESTLGRQRTHIGRKYRWACHPRVGSAA
eukprot:scaffold4917_cov172-Amphora_coffeaeformis.AAC.4